MLFQEEAYRSDTRRTKLPAHRSQCERECRRVPPRTTSYPCDGYDGDESHCSGGGADLTVASPRAWYPSGPLTSGGASNWP